MPQSSDILCGSDIKKYLSAENKNMKTEIYESLDSTSRLLRAKAEAGEGEGLVIIADSQTAGLGSRGRSFFSPAGTGLYMSLLLRPEAEHCPDTPAFTVMAAVCVCEEINCFCGGKAGIKWVNDIYIGDKKVCGILTQGSFCGGKAASYALLGIGINVYPPYGGFPGELNGRAGFLSAERQPQLRNRLAAGIINRFMRLYRSNGKEEYIERYKKLSFLKNREITVLLNGEKRRATALGIDDGCRLLVKFENGEKKALFCGEASLEL